MTQKIYTFEPVRYGKLISQRVAGDAYVHADALGTTRTLSSTGTTVIDTFLYDAWGNEVARTGTTAIVPFRWVGGVGYYYDTETGLYYVRARVYQPTVARWARSLFFADVCNSYEYSRNRPNRRLDASGLLSAPGEFDDQVHWPDSSTNSLPCRDQIYWDYDSDKQRDGRQIPNECICECRDTQFNTIEFGEFDGTRHGVLCEPYKSLTWVLAQTATPRLCLIGTAFKQIRCRLVDLGSYL